MNNAGRVDQNIREVARVIVFDAAQSILLLRYSEGFSGEPADYWATPGGAIEPGESPASAAARELYEETGLSAQIGVELWAQEFTIPTKEKRTQRERFFRVDVAATAPPTFNATLEPIREQRWWTLAELTTTVATVYPKDLAERLGTLFSQGQATV